MYLEINLPQSLLLDIVSDIKVIRLENSSNIVHFKSKLDNLIRFYSKNSKVLYFYLKNLELLKTINNLKYNHLNIYFSINRKNIQFIKDNGKILKNFYLKAEIDNIVKSDELVDLLKFLSFHKIKSELSYDLFKQLNSDELSKLTKEIILDKNIIKDIEPLFGFVNYIYEKNYKKEISLDLWQLFKDKRDEFIYITSDGFVTISKRWDKRGKYLYNIYDTIRSENSQLSKELDAYEQNLFFKNLECAMCENYEFCKAYLKFENNKYDCSGFKNMLTIIKDNFIIYKEEKEKVA